MLRDMKKVLQNKKSVLKPARQREKRSVEKVINCGVTK